MRANIAECLSGNIFEEAAGMSTCHDYDVAVVGGGVAGVAAAAAAARMGAKTVLIEKTCVPGGLASAGLINIYLPLCDGNGSQVTFGIAEELMRRALKYGPGTIPPDWMTKRDAAEAERLRCVFAPASLILAVEELLLENGVDVWYDTLAVSVCKDGRYLQTLSVENTDGRSEIHAKAFVDATGGAYLSRMAGEEVFFAGNVLSFWTLEYEGKRLPGRDRMAPEINMLARGNADRTFTAPTAKDVSRYMLETRAMMRNFYAGEYSKNGYDRFSRWSLVVPSMPQFRKIAALKGHFVLESGMEHCRFEDSIGLAADWRKSGPVWEIPFRTLCPRGTDNLFAAGRCISSIGDAWEITRVIPCAALTGEAAGYAAALRAENMTAELSDSVRRRMLGNGNLLHSVNNPAADCGVSGSRSNDECRMLQSR